MEQNELIIECVCVCVCVCLSVCLSVRVVYSLQQTLHGGVLFSETTTITNNPPPCPTSHQNDASKNIRVIIFNSDTI